MCIPGYSYNCNDSTYLDILQIIPVYLGIHCINPVYLAILTISIPKYTGYSYICTHIHTRARIPVDSILNLFLYN